MNSDGQPLTHDATPTRPMKTTWLAVDADPHHSRLVVVADRLILDAFEATAGPRQAQRTLDFIRQTVPVDTNVKLVGRRNDRWPQQLHTALVQEFGPVTWINLNVLIVTLPAVERWRRMFNTYRALFFAICADEDLKRPFQFLDQYDLLDAWKGAVLNDLMTDVAPKTARDAMLNSFFD